MACVMQKIKQNGLMFRVLNYDNYFVVCQGKMIGGFEFTGGIEALV